MGLSEIEFADRMTRSYATVGEASTSLEDYIWEDVFMKKSHLFLLLLATCFSVPSLDVMAQNTPAPAAAADGSFHYVYVRPNGDTELLLYEPDTLGPNSRFALVYSHPNRDNFNDVLGREMVKRGYRVLMVNFRGEDDYGRAMPESYLPPIGEGVKYLRTLPGLEKVLLVGHSGSGHVGSLYQNVAENGPGACSDPAKMYPCPTEDLADLGAMDGMIFLDSTLGAFHNMSAVDPAQRDDGTRDVTLDMFAPENGYNLETGRATYSPEFLARFFAAQAARSDAIIAQAEARLAIIDAGEGEFSNDEPFIVRGVGPGAAGARIYAPDLSLVSHTKVPHLLLKADGTEVETIIESVRPRMGQQVPGRFDELDLVNYVTTVRRFIGDSSIRVGADYAITADDIVGVDWASSFESSPANAEGIHVPALVMVMTCHYLVVPGEIIYDHLGSTDKTFVGVEGAAHSYRGCRPEYGDTTARMFNYVDGWLNEPGRFY